MNKLQQEIKDFHEKVQRILKIVLEQYNKKNGVSVLIGGSLMHESDLKFLQLLPEEIKKHPDDLLTLRQCLMNFKNHGMDKESMLENLEKLRSGSDSETEDILLELMDFAAGWCNPDLSVFD